MTIQSSQSSPWLSMEVRPWLVLTVVLLVVAIVMTSFRLIGYLHEREVLKNGVVVQATVMFVGLSQSREGTRDDELRVGLGYHSPDGQWIETSGDLPRKPGEMISLKQILPVRIDPAHPSFWTAREEPQPIIQVLLIPSLCVPIALICGAIAWLRQRTIRAITTLGAARAASVLNVKLSPLAPLSKLIGVTLIDDPGRRVLHCYWPGSRGPVHSGDALEVKTSTNGKHAIVA